jgi:hypothetical protein
MTNFAEIQYDESDEYVGTPYVVVLRDVLTSPVIETRRFPTYLLAHDFALASARTINYDYRAGAPLQRTRGSFEEKIKAIVNTVTPRGAFDSDPETCVKLILAEVLGTSDDEVLAGVLEELQIVSELHALPGIR